MAEGTERRSASSGAVAVLVVAVVVMMVVPLPTWLLDLLLTFNLALSVALLLAAVYAREALSIAGFPTLLVLTTLFRLGLNVSTTRLILLQADAGHVVQAFGSFVVQGDYLVGAAVFLILTVVQYIVISRGAERVAEVAARFTLDAMPGKQLAIDAELRSGGIDGNEARRRRHALGREAQLYGALDGAMRFVKGDAVAGLFIVTLSMVGGLAIGLLRRGLPIGEAAKLYTLLTIGDGLVTQLPALLLSTAAGLIVTRVASDRDDELFEGRPLAALVTEPAALWLVALLLGALALLPGLPFVPFAAVALVFALAWWRARRRPHEPARTRLWPRRIPAIEVAIHPTPAARERGWQRQLEASARWVVDDLGIPLPPIAERVDDTLPSGSFQVRVRGFLRAEGRLGAADDTSDSDLRKALEATLRRSTGELLGIDEAQQLVDRLGETDPVLVREVVPRKVDLTTLAEVLRRLVGEGIPISDLRPILEALGREAERDPGLLTERARVALRRHISRRIAPENRLAALLLDPIIEETVREAVRPSGEDLALEPALANDIVSAVGREVARREAERPAIVTTTDLRRHVRRLVESEHPRLPVVTYQELDPEVVVEPVGRIGVGF